MCLQERSLIKSTLAQRFSKDLPDVQSTIPDVRINLTRVGVKNVKKLVEEQGKIKEQIH